MVESREPSLTIDEQFDNNVANNETALIPKYSVFNNVHKLQNSWTMWFLNNNKDLTWTERLNQVCTIDTVEHFWSLYDNIRPPSVCMSCDYNLFKEGIEPMWEVTENKNGGRLLVQIERGRNDLLDALWLELLLSLVGNQYGADSGNICGAVCNIRAKGSKICLWTRDASDMDANSRIGLTMKNRLSSLEIVGAKQLRVVYENHSDVQNKSSSGVKSSLFI